LPPGLGRGQDKGLAEYWEGKKGKRKRDSWGEAARTRKKKGSQLRDTRTENANIIQHMTKREERLGWE